MRILLITLCLALLPLIASTQTDNIDRHAMAAKVIGIDYGALNDVDLEQTFGLEIAYRYMVSKNIGVALPLKFGVANVKDDTRNRNITSLDGLLHYYPFNYDGKIVPYFLGGIGYVVENLDTGSVQFPLGIGLNFKVGTNSYITSQFEYRSANVDDRDNLQLGLGYLYQFGKIDSDGDGISDNLDECPDVVGPAATNGCPDMDNDGVANKDDKCPDVAGAKETMGCPDTDGDGIGDADDMCPEEAGLALFKGCPDSDEDGVADKDDLCPTVAGDVMMAGCPDTDGDTIHDGIDKCPEEAGTEETEGCPFADTDGDGVIDEEDMCPEEAGLVSMKGCPDSDGDGVIDSEDRCPNKKGPYTGCPDTDGDGVIDADDRCVDEAGPVTNKGCPEIKEDVREVLNLAMRAVQFESGSAKLKESSYVILDRIADAMKQYPAYKLRIAGHTDSVGDADRNKELSEQRAKACYDYLKLNDIPASMMSYRGYGEDYPITSNERSAGRALNRRVEFDLIIE